MYGCKVRNTLFSKENVTGGGGGRKGDRTNLFQIGELEPITPDNQTTGPMLRALKTRYEIKRSSYMRHLSKTR